ncbi:TPA: hypothetical protein UN036_000025 [Stenotrophomonas maltophilia]|nr:hypothetical protein [Stenotrophomonas maltophilia]
MSKVIDIQTAARYQGILASAEATGSSHAAEVFLNLRDGKQLHLIAKDAAEALIDDLLDPSTTREEKLCELKSFVLSLVEQLPEFA